MTSGDVAKILAQAKALTKEELLQLRDGVDYLIFAKLTEQEKYALAKGLGWRPR